MNTQTDLEQVRAKFRDAGVQLRMPGGPFVVGVRDRAVLQMDIRKTRQGGVPREEVWLWPGEAEVKVLGVERRLRQLVLRVRESERTFAVRSWDADSRTWLTRRERVPGEERRFLVGMDERHLFFARVPKRTHHVREAHELLMPTRVHAAWRRGLDVKRQGEFFFIPVSDRERALIKSHLVRAGAAHKGRLVPVRKGQVLQTDRKGHFARQHLLIGIEQFACGDVVHQDHRTLVLSDWHRVEMNAESQVRVRQGHARWVD